MTMPAAPGAGVAEFTLTGAPGPLAIELLVRNTGHPEPARGGVMLKNSTYNLMETASVISKGLFRYDQFMKDAKDCQQCQQVWQLMKQRDEEQLNRILDHMKQHLDKDMKGAAAA
jgi:hypothetical protein